MTLEAFASYAVARVPGSSAFLITDNPSLWKLFPGKVIDYRPDDREEVIHFLRRRYPEKVLLSNGFWMATLERLFALRLVRSHVHPNTQLVHLETDVISLLCPEYLRVLRESVQNPAVPRESSHAGCASIL